MHHLFTAVLISVAIVALIIVCTDVGFRVGRRKLAGSAELSAAGAGDPGIGAIDGAVFGLMGLLLAFAFYGAHQRWDIRREQIVTEANAIGTVWLRIDLLPPAEQPAVRDLVRTYLDTRLEAYRLFPDYEKVRAKLADAVGIQSTIWAKTLTAIDRMPERSDVRLLLVPALNDMFDIAAIRSAANYAHPPPVTFALLFALILAAAFVTGHALAANGRRHWVQIVAFAIVVGLTLFVVLDLEYPRFGFIRLEAVDQLLVDVRAGMK